MNPTLGLNFWAQLVGILALEILCVIALGFLAQSLTRSAFWRRTIWQISLVCALLLASAELTGVGRGFSIWMAGKPVPERTVSVRIVPTDEPLLSSSTEYEFPAPIFVPEKEAPIVRSIWWPGILWAVGFGLIAARILFARVLFVALRWRNQEIDDSVLAERTSELANRLGINRRIHLLELSGLASPVAFGIFQSNIGVPRGFSQKFTAAQQNAMLTHELAHLAARDPFWYLLADCVAAMFWWHPAVWLARRRLQSASEHAADEAAVILENGPGTLAECLVNLGQQLTRRRSFGWLGVQGNGFRSHLGQRVERLLNLKESKKERLRGWPLFFTKTAVTIFFGGLIIFTSGWIQNGKEQREANLSTAVQKSWNGSFASTAFAALAERQKTPHFENASDSNPKPTAGKKSILVTARIIAISPTVTFADGSNGHDSSKPTGQAEAIGDAIMEGFGSQLLGTPHILNIEGQEGSIFVGKEKPNDPDTNSTGVFLTVLPHVKDDSIELIMTTRIGDFSSEGKWIEGSGITSKTNFLVSPRGSAVLWRKQTEAQGGTNYFIIVTPRVVADDEAQTVRRAPAHPLYDEVTVETLIYNDFSPEQFEEVKEILAPSFAPRSSNQHGDVLTVSSNDLQKILFALSKFKERMVSPRDCGRFVAPFDMVGSKFSGMQTSYRGSPTNSGNNCEYFTETRNGIVVVTGAAISHQTSNSWSFSLVPQKRNGLVEIRFMRNDSGKESAKQWTMPNEGGAIVQHRFPDDPARNQLIVFSSQRLPREKENKLNEKEARKNASPSREQDAKIRAATLVQDGKVFFEAGKLEEAEVKLNEALKIDPYNNAAFYYKSRIKKAKQVPQQGAELIRPTVPPTTLDKIDVPLVRNKPAPHDKVAYTSKGRQSIKAKLDLIRFSKVEYENFPLGELLKSLQAESQARDPDHVGVNFLFNPHPVAVTNTPAPAPVDPNDIIINISPALVDVRLADVLNSLVQAAKTPIQYRIEDYAVVISPKTPEAIALYTRVFKINSEKLKESLKSYDSGPAWNGNYIESSSPSGNSFSVVSKTNLSARANLQLRNYLNAAGVDFGPPGTSNGKAIFFNNRAGTLMVRATLEDLEIISTAIEALNYEPPQITIEATFVELDEAAMKKLGLDWFTRNAVSLSTNGTASDVFLKGTIVTNSQGIVEYRSNSLPVVAAIFTKAQYQSVLKDLEKTTADILATPKATTLSGRQTQISVLDQISIETSGSVTNAGGIVSTGLQTNTYPFGPALDVLPSISADGVSIQMTVIPMLTEFLGYDKASPTPLPRSRLQQFVESVKIWDGQTVGLGTLHKSDVAADQKKLFIFVTATITDSAGNRVNLEKDMPFATNSVPKQPEQK